MLGRWQVTDPACCFWQASLEESLAMAGYAASLIIKCSLHQALFKGLITAYCKTIYSGMQAAELLRIMGSIGINVSPAANAENELADALELHDLLRAGVV